MIDFALGEDERLVQDEVRRFAQTALRPAARACERARGVTEALVRDFAALGLALADVPEALGGLGASATTLALVHEELAWGDPGAAVALWSTGLVPPALALLGSDEQAKRLLAGLVTGAVAWSGDVTATRDGDDWILRGEKRFVVNAGRADTTIVFTANDAFAVTAPLEAGPRAEWLGLEAVTAGPLRLHDVRVAEADRLVHGGDRARIRRFFARAALVTAARQVGLARAAYETALAYTQDRHAFGKPVAHFQSIAFTLADMHMDVESARWMVWRAAASGDDTDAFEAFVHANAAAWRVADDAVQLHGGAGYIQDFPVEKWLRDTKTLALLGGVDEFARLVIAEELLGHELAGAGPEASLQPAVT